MTLDFLYDIFLLNLALKAAQGTFESFAILKMDFCQSKFTTFQMAQFGLTDQLLTFS